MIVDRVDLLLSAQCALLGNVFPRLRAVCVNSTENIIFVCFYCDGEISEDDKELCECTLDDIIADFLLPEREGHKVKFETPIVRLDYPQKMPLVGNWVYYRHEE